MSIPSQKSMRKKYVDVNKCYSSSELLTTALHAIDEIERIAREEGYVFVEDHPVPVGGESDFVYSN